MFYWRRRFLRGSITLSGIRSTIVSLWGIAIKTSLGKLEMAIDFPSIINKIEDNGFVILPIFPEHTVCVSSLPFHHRDWASPTLSTASNYR